jgi:hypothetical protein
MADTDKIMKQEALPGVASLIRLNIRRFESELKTGYEMVQAACRNHAPLAPAPTFDAWAFKLVDAVFNDMLEAKVNHHSAETYTEEVGRRLKMKIKWAVKQAKEG